MQSKRIYVSKETELFFIEKNSSVAYFQRTQTLPYHRTPTNLCSLNIPTFCRSLLSVSRFLDTPNQGQQSSILNLGYSISYLYSAHLFHLISISFKISSKETILCLRRLQPLFKGLYILKAVLKFHLLIWC